MDSWYPTIYFYDMEKGKIVWRIFGAEIFLKINHKQNAMVFSNRIWTKLNASEYGDLKEQDPEFSRFSEFSCCILEIEYMQREILSDFGVMAEEERRDMRAPEVMVTSNYVLHFGLNKNLVATKECKIVEARMHNADKRVTLLYPCFGSFTFVLSEDLPLTQKSEWLVSYKKQNYNLSICFDPSQPIAWGNGFDDNHNKVDMRLQMKGKADPHHWEAKINTGSGVEILTIEDLAFKRDKAKIVLEAKWESDEKEYILAGTFI